MTFKYHIIHVFWNWFSLFLPINHYFWIYHWSKIVPFSMLSTILDLKLDSWSWHRHLSKKVAESQRRQRCSSFPLFLVIEYPFLLLEVDKPGSEKTGKIQYTIGTSVSELKFHCHWKKTQHITIYVSIRISF